MMKFLLIFILAAPAYCFDWPLKVNSNNRYLEDQSGEPFFVNGEAAWGTPYMLDSADLTLFLDDCVANGITTLTMRTATPNTGYNAIAPTNVYGVIPFTGGAFDQPVEAYWTNVDYVLNEMKSRSMVAMFAPLYFANTDANGYRDEAVAQGTNVCNTFGQWIGSRYKDQGNIIWLAYGDCNPTAAEKLVMQHVMAGIRLEDTNHLASAHQGQGTSGRAQSGTEPWFDVNTVYHYTDSGYNSSTSRRYMEREYNSDDISPNENWPVFLVEYKFEGDGQGATSLDLRRLSWWSVLEAGVGQFYGNHLVCENRSGWDSTGIDSTNRTNLRWIYNLAISRELYKIVPDTSDTVVTAGKGSIDSIEYAPAGLTSDSRSMFAYLPVSTTLTVAMTSFSGAVNAWWYNPRNGEATFDAQYANTGTQNFTSPDSQDWVLVLDLDGEFANEPGQPAQEALTALANTARVGTIQSAQ